MGSESIAPPFLTSALDGGERLIHTLAVLSPGKNPTVSIRGWVDWTLQGRYSFPASY
jgi:hypothetical protein